MRPSTLVAAKLLVAAVASTALARANADDTADWPTYQHDAQRSGFTPHALQMPLRLAWTCRTAHPPCPAWPPPARQDFWHHKTNLPPRVVFDRAHHVVSDGRRVLFGTSADDRLVCLDLASGRPLWSFFAEGPIRLAPTLDADRVYFGSDDGCAYCLQIDDGRLLWRRRVAPDDRRVAGNGRVISAWPVRSGVVVEGDRVRVAAGLFPLHGTYQALFRADDGELLARATLNFSPQGYMQRNGGQLMIATGRTPPARLESAPAAPSVDLGALPEGYPYALVGADRLRIAGGDGKVVAYTTDDPQPVWTAEVEGRAYSLAVAAGRLLVSTDRGVVYCFADTTVKTDARAADRRDAAKAAAKSPIYADADLRAAYEAAAERVLSHTPMRRGYCLVLASDHGRLAYEIARRTEMQVVGVETDAAKADCARQLLHAHGLYGRVSIHHGQPETLPYTSRLFNLVVVDGGLQSGVLPMTADEVHRVLAPHRGVACLGAPDGRVDAADRATQVDAWCAASNRPDAWQVVRRNGVWLVGHREPADEAGQWTHIYADPANTASSGDELLRGPLALQWFGPPGPREMIDRHHRTVPPLAVAGRLFVPGDNRVFCVDAFNGAPLWQRELPDSRRVGVMRDAGSMAAAADRLYVAAGETCLGIAAESGDVDFTATAPPAEDGQPRRWGYVAVVGNRLFGSTTRPGASRTGHSRATIAGTYYDFVPVVTSDTLFCVDRRDGRQQWRFQPTAGAIVNPTITIGGDCVYFVESGNPETLETADGRATLAQLVGTSAELVALDARQGKLLWRRPLEMRALQHHLFLSYVDQRLVAVGSRNASAEGASRATVWYDAATFSADDGRPLWRATQNNGQPAGGSHGEQDHHPVIVGNRLIVEPLAYDLRSGEQVADWRLARGGHGCGTISASANELFFRAGNPARCGLAAPDVGRLTHATRPGCWINIIPAGGLVLIPEASSGCTCNFSVQTSMALGPVR